MQPSEMARRVADPVAPGLPLPVSAARVELRPMTGEAELLLAEGRPNDPWLALRLLELLGAAEPGFVWSALPIHDVDALIVYLRRAQAGDRVAAEASCANADCGERVDLSFGLGAYLAHHRPRPVRARSWAVEPSEDAAGWLRLVANRVRGGSLPASGSFRRDRGGERSKPSGGAGGAVHLPGRFASPHAEAGGGGDGGDRAASGRRGARAVPSMRRGD